MNIAIKNLKIVIDDAIEALLKVISPWILLHNVKPTKHDLFRVIVLLIVCLSVCLSVRLPVCRCVGLACVFFGFL